MFTPYHNPPFPGRLGGTRTRLSLGSGKRRMSGVSQPEISFNYEGLSDSDEENGAPAKVQKTVDEPIVSFPLEKKRLFTSVEDVSTEAMSTSVKKDVSAALDINCNLAPDFKYYLERTHGARVFDKFPLTSKEVVVGRRENGTLVLQKEYGQAHAIECLYNSFMYLFQELGPMLYL